MDAGAQHTCKGSRCDACTKNTPTDNAAEGILLDCCCGAWGHGMPANAGISRGLRPSAACRGSASDAQPLTVFGPAFGPRSLYDSIGSQQQRLGDCEAERFRGLAADDKL